MGPHSIGVVQGTYSKSMYGIDERYFYDKEVAEAYMKYKQEYNENGYKYRVVEEEVI